MAATVRDPAMKDTIPFIPDDVMLNIYKRLPVRSLTRFQVVCKNWKYLIKDLIKTSIEDHLHYCSHRNVLLLLEQYQRRYGDIHLDEQDCDMGLGEVQKSPSIHSLLNFQVVGSHNGLVCLKMVEKCLKPDLLLIWNPATRDIREVRLRTIFHPELYDEDLRPYFEADPIDHLGFGFSPFDNDYKIVRIHMLRPFYIKVIEVYSLNYGSWKEVDFGDHQEVISLWGGVTSITINGVMFWETMWRYDENLILSVDLSKQVCRLRQMPCNGVHSPRCLIEYENKLALVAHLKGRYELDLIHLWVMENDTLKWTEIYTSSSPPPREDLYPLTIWRNEIVLEVVDWTENDDQTIILYLLNLATKKFKRLALY